MTDKKKLEALEAAHATANDLRRKLNTQINARLAERHKVERPLERKLDAANNKLTREQYKKVRAIARKHRKEMSALYAKISNARDALRRKFDAQKKKAVQPVTNKIVALQRKWNAAQKACDKLATDLRMEQNREHMPPAKGAFVAYKKCNAPLRFGTIIVKLEVGKAAKRLCSDMSQFKCRVSSAKVLDMWYSVPPLEASKPTVAHSQHDHTFTYVIGKTVRPRKPFDKTRAICSSGIHCFMSQRSAENH